VIGGEKKGKRERDVYVNYGGEEEEVGDAGCWGRYRELFCSRELKNELINLPMIN
jgi:hypothetical protein